MTFYIHHHLFFTTKFTLYPFSTTFHDLNRNSMTFKAWKAKFLDFMTFLVFHDLHKPCNKSLYYTDMSVLL